MVDKELLKESDGAAVTVDNKGNEIITGILQELMKCNNSRINHSNLHRSGWPQVYPMINHPLPKKIAMMIDNLIDHNLFNSQFQNITVDSSDYKEKFVSFLGIWNSPETDLLLLFYNG